MKRKQLALELARRQNLRRAEAQDEVDEVVAALIRQLRKGEPVKLPGIGQIVPENLKPRDPNTDQPPANPIARQRAGSEGSGNPRSSNQRSGNQ